MRIPAIALTILLLSAPLALAQQQPQLQPPTAQNDQQLDMVLGQWERAMTDMKSLVAIMARTKKDRAFGTTETFEGTAKFQKPNKASLELVKKGRQDIFEKIICNGSVVFLYSPQDKEIRVHKLPEPKPGQVTDDNFLTFLFGMKAADAKRRYSLKLVPPPPGDKWYYYIEVVPRDRADAAEFSKARLVLSITTGLPRQLWFVEPNGNEVTWDFNQMTPNAMIRPQDFDRPAPPPGWQLRVMPDTQPARVIRP